MKTQIHTNIKMDTDTQRETDKQGRKTDTNRSPSKLFGR